MLIPVFVAVSMTAAFATAPAAVTVPPAEEHDAPQRRLVVAPTDNPSLLLFEATTGESVGELQLDSPATYASALTEDGRFLLAAHDDGVTVVDGGVWSTSHGDHSHHYSGRPAVVGRVDGENPSHLISHNGLTALWFDGFGEAVVIDEEELAKRGVAEIGRVGNAEPHHGFAVPTADDQFVVSAMAGPDDVELPDSVAVVNSSGETLESFTCADTHGEAALGDGAYAAACADGILLLTDGNPSWTADVIPYPETGDVDPYGMGAARAWAIGADDGFDFGISALGTTHLLRLDPATGEVAAFDLGAQIATFGVQPHAASGLVVVLTTDGNLHVIDPADGSTVSSVAVVDPFEEGEDFDTTYHQLVLGGEVAYVSDPRNDAVVAVSIGDELAVTDTFDLGVEPAFIEVFNG